VTGDSGFGLAASRFLRAIPAASEADEPGRPLLERHLLDILAATLGQSAGIAAEGDQRAARLLAAKAQADHSLADQDFGREELARSLGLSVRTLTRLFAAEGETPAGYLRKRRLERCRADLASPAHADRSVTEIALAYGFNDSAHFSRLFRTAYGEPPAQYRARTKATARRSL
jgi:transcriptional regulator GlxA family with amidase domain